MENTSAERFDPQESLRVIHQTIDLAKRKVRESGFHFVLWGSLLSVTGIAHYYLTDIAQVAWSHWVWLIQASIGGVIAFGYEMRREKRGHKPNLISRWYALIWLGFVATLLFMLVWSAFLETSPTPPILATAGMAVFMSGIVLEFRPLVWGSVALWVGAFACLFVSGAQDSLVFAAAVALGYVMPGIILNQKTRP